MPQDLWYKPKLIEVALPLEDINKESVREGFIYRGNPSAIHKWWAQRPLAACRAVLFAQLVDDPSAHPDKFPTEEDQAVERKRLHDIISRLVVWENIHDEKLLHEAHEEIHKSTGGNPPAILDPFAGGGSIPLEAQRLGLEAHASDLNPVAVLINKALIEIPPKWAGHKPVFPGAAAEKLSWPGATGLAEDVRHYGKWMRDGAEKRIGHLYPKVKVGGVDCSVIAWIWARTVTCPNPACAGTMPLVRSFWLGKKKGKQRYIIPIPDDKKIRFEIGGPDGIPREGTVGRNGATCLLCGTPVPLSYVRDEAKGKRMGAQLMAIVAEGERQRFYVGPSSQHEAVADVARPPGVADNELPERALSFRVQGYGMSEWADLYTNRQLVTLATFSDLILEAREHAISVGAEPEYANAIACYLACSLSKTADYNCTFAVWYPQEDRPKNLFARHSIPMVWDYPEINPLIDIGGTWTGSIRVVADAMSGIPSAVKSTGYVQQCDAATVHIPAGAVVCTDPPYYSNVGYADLSDFFYVWLRRSLRDIYPEIFQTLLTPKEEEMIASPFRKGSMKAAEKFFENRFREVFALIEEGAPTGYPTTVFYAFKQAETDQEGQQASTGWETLLEGMLSSGWVVTATWPIRTERISRAIGLKSNALASSVVLACRPRPADAGSTDRLGFIQALQSELPDALQKLEHDGKVAPVDLAQAAIGPGMAIFSRYAQVNEPDGKPMRVRMALKLINQALGEILSSLEGDVSADTRFCVEWFKQYGFDDGPYGKADVLARGVDTSVDGLGRAGVLRSGQGKVRLFSSGEIPAHYEPTTDDRTSEWEICLHLARQLSVNGVDAAARLMAQARTVDGIDLDDVRELSYLLYSIAEQKGWAETALLFNGLGTSWTDIEDASRQAGVVAAATSGQGEFQLTFGSDDDGDE
jgi:putative DNA methylase